jgi:hypothetical protein
VILELLVGAVVELLELAVGFWHELRFAIIPRKPMTTGTSDTLLENIMTLLEFETYGRA